MRNNFRLWVKDDAILCNFKSERTKSKGKEINNSYITRGHLIVITLGTDFSGCWMKGPDARYKVNHKNTRTWH